MAEFTGERVIPGLVEPDLWNEHVARYYFARNACEGRKTLDVGCGAGYGSHLLAESASLVVGIDSSRDAILLARDRAPANSLFLVASAAAMPLADACFDVVAAFEVIEHLVDWPHMLREVRRVLAPEGVFIVSTPNKSYYAESRSLSGPNPFHHHEFEYEEFRDALSETFDSVSVFVQNHAAAVTIQDLQAERGQALLEGRADPNEAHFFVAVCGAAPPSIAFIPQSGNLLRERESHIHKLQNELAQKTGWLTEAQQNHAQLVTLHEETLGEMRRRAEFAREQEERIVRSGRRILELQTELATLHAESADTIERLEKENERKTQWALDTERRLTDELIQRTSAYTEALRAVEQTLEERTVWAKELDAQRERLETQLAGYDASRWTRLGRKLGVGPQSRD